MGDETEERVLRALSLKTAFIDKRHVRVIERGVRGCGEVQRR
jgi:hypothetical protein